MPCISQVNWTQGRRSACGRSADNQLRQQFGLAGTIGVLLLTAHLPTVRPRGGTRRRQYPCNGRDVCRPLHASGRQSIRTNAAAIAALMHRPPALHEQEPVAKPGRLFVPQRGSEVRLPARERKLEVRRRLSGLECFDNGTAVRFRRLLTLLR